MMTMFVYATDEDHALEIAGNGADEEFESLDQAIKGFDPEVHSARSIFEITVNRRTGGKGGNA